MSTPPTPPNPPAPLAELPPASPAKLRELAERAASAGRIWDAQSQAFLADLESTMAVFRVRVRARGDFRWPDRVGRELVNARQALQALEDARSRLLWALECIELEAKRAAAK